MRRSTYPPSIIRSRYSAAPVCTTAAPATIEHDCTVQHRRADFELSAADTHEGLLIRCHVKIGRKNSVARRERELGVAFFGDFSAMLPQAQDQIIERFTRFRRYFNPREALVGTLLSNFNLRDLEIRAPGQNLIEHLRQN